MTRIPVIGAKSIKILADHVKLIACAAVLIYVSAVAAIGLARAFGKGHAIDIREEAECPGARYGSSSGT